MFIWSFSYTRIKQKPNVNIFVEKKESNQAMESDYLHTRLIYSRRFWWIFEKNFLEQEISDKKNLTFTCLFEINR